VDQARDLARAILTPRAVIIQFVIRLAVLSLAILCLFAWLVNGFLVLRKWAARPAQSFLKFCKCINDFAGPVERFQPPFFACGRFLCAP
jgi:hypothetical protein